MPFYQAEQCNCRTASETASFSLVCHRQRLSARLPRFSAGGQRQLCRLHAQHLRRAPHRVGAHPRAGLLHKTTSESAAHKPRERRDPSHELQRRAGGRRAAARCASTAGTASVAVCSRLRGLGRAPHRQDSVRAALVDTARAAAASAFAMLWPCADTLLHEQAQAAMEPRPAPAPPVRTVIGPTVPSKGVGLHSSLAAGRAAGLLARDPTETEGRTGAS
jgi:hypothetical protein